MSVEENRAVVRRWIEGPNTRGAGAVDELVAADFADAQLQERLGEPESLDTFFKESLRALDRSLGRAQFDEKEMLASHRSHGSPSAPARPRAALIPDSLQE